MKITRYSWSLLASVGLSVSTQAFSLIGIADPSQVFAIGYFANGVGIRSYDQQGDLGGPRNLGSEFRWSSPIITYGFDATFLDYFGTNGVIAVEKAIKVLNDLPAASKMTPGLTEFPLRTAGANFAAQRLHLFDLKSFTLSILLEQMGLAAPERWVWCLKDREGPPPERYLIINRNFDPVTQTYSPFINGTRYSFVIGTYTTPAGQFWDARKVALDAAEPNITVASLHGIQGGELGIDDRVARQMRYTFGNIEGQAAIGSWGLYFSGLTRDDAGGIRHLIQPRNRNYESAPLGSTGRSGLTVSSVTPGTSGGGTGGGNSPFRLVDDLPVVAVVPTATAGGTPAVTAAPAIQIEAVRSGVDKIGFIRVDLDPLTRRINQPIAVQYQETIVTNGTSISQQVERILVQPDILFSAADIGQTLAIPFVYRRTLNLTQPARTAVDVINNPNNTLGYPGNISGTVDITFSTIGPHYIDNQVGDNQANSSYGFLWGSFDGTTNRPIVYPVGQVDLKQLEQAALKEK